jgi:hypothetical protein
LTPLSFSRIRGKTGKNKRYSILQKYVAFG